MCDHDHDHDHDHGRDDAGHVHHAPDGVRSGPVVLDLGPGVGALIVHTAPELLGVEVELSPAGDDETRQHKQVLQRRLGGSTATVLVYDNLPEGAYTLWLDEAEPVRGIHVTGGRVAELDRRHSLASR
jgi:hypothetical protein